MYVIRIFIIHVGKPDKNNIYVVVYEKRKLFIKYSPHEPLPNSTAFRMKGAVQTLEERSGETETSLRTKHITKHENVFFILLAHCHYIIMLLFLLLIQILLCIFYLLSVFIFFAN